MTRYQYDALGNRISCSSGATTNYFNLNYQSGRKVVLAEMNATGAVTRYYIWGAAGLLAHIDSDGVTTRYYHADEQGSTLALTDGSGKVTDQFAYQPYGVLGARTGSTPTPYQWLGGAGVRCEAGDLYAMQCRFYSSAQKRFLSADPSGIDSFANLYAYGNCNPNSLIDPDGLCADNPINILDSTSGDHSPMVGQDPNAIIAKLEVDSPLKVEASIGAFIKVEGKLDKNLDPSGKVSVGIPGLGKVDTDGNVKIGIDQSLGDGVGDRVTFKAKGNPITGESEVTLNASSVVLNSGVKVGIQKTNIPVGSEFNAMHQVFAVFSYTYWSKTYTYWAGGEQGYNSGWSWWNNFNGMDKKQHNYP